MSAVDLSTIRTDGGTQPRAAIDTMLVETYAEDMASGAVFPPLVIFHDGVTNWLADGFHRFYAAKGCGLAEFECDVRQGTVRDAILFSVSANASHGLRRTNEDKRRAVLTLLNDPTWAQWSDREISRHCAVTHEMVGRLRPAPSGGERQMARTVERGGSTYTMNIAPRAPAPPREDRPVFDNTPSGEPAAPPTHTPTAEQVQTVRDDWQAGRGVTTDLRMVTEAMGRLPSPQDAAASFPRSLRHTLTPAQLRQMGDWLHAFAAAWEHENGVTHVAA